jgi:DNA (cytosine-5)-methyltransferase 1
MRKKTTVSLFSGAGGESLGKALAFQELGIEVQDMLTHAINHWDLAVATHTLNQPHIHVHREDISRVTARTYGLEHIEMLWASPSCIHHSRARGGRPRSDQQRSHAWEVVDRWLRLARVDVLLVENVPEFVDWGPLDEGGLPIKSRRGEDFRAFVEALRVLGYQVEWRVLCAADYGDPTTRRRFFLQAARDGRPIAWPEPTHHDPRKPGGEGLPPWRAAAECIDWSLPCPSIFTRKKPLAEATMRRIATGVVRYVLGGRPFLVTCNHADNSFRGQGTDQPFNTIVAANEARGVVVPTVAPCIVNFRGTEPSHVSSSGSGADEPLRTVSAGGNHAALVAPSLIQTSYGERRGQAPRVLDLGRPLGTVVAGGQKHALVSAFLAKSFGGPAAIDKQSPGISPAGPLGTVTARDHHTLVQAELGQEGTEGAKKVAAFLLHYYSSGTTSQHPGLPLHTITTIARHGLVTVEVDGASYVVTDIGLRMLEPRELARAMGFPDTYRWERAPGVPLSKRDAVKMIGNACPVNTTKELIKAVVLQRRRQYGLGEAAA